MKHKALKSSFLIFLFSGIFLLACQAEASEPIAKISKFRGVAKKLTGDKIVNVSVGLPIAHGDWIQTWEGQVQIEFNDGAITKVSKFSSVMIREREEDHGFFSGKTKTKVRRLSCFAGKVWLKLGKSKKRENYLQTPSTVVGVRGSEIGFFDGKSFFIGDPFLIQGVKPIRKPLPPRHLTARNLLQSTHGRAFEKAHRTGFSHNALEARNGALGAIRNLPLPPHVKHHLMKEQNAVRDIIKKLPPRTPKQIQREKEIEKQIAAKIKAMGKPPKGEGIDEEAEDEVAE